MTRRYIRPAQPVETVGSTPGQVMCSAHPEDRLPCEKCAIEAVESDRASFRCEFFGVPLNNEKPTLGQNAAEAQRMTYAGRRPELLREARTFDSARVEAMDLFAPARSQQGLFSSQPNRKTGDNPQ